MQHYQYRQNRCEDAEAAVRAFLSEMQFKVERQTFNESKKIEGVIRPVERQRLTSAWLPVNEDSRV